MEKYGCWPNSVRCQILLVILYSSLVSTSVDLYVTNAYTTPSPDSGEFNARPLETATTSLSPTSTMNCISTSDKLFKFVMSTHRNGSGYWIADMDVQHGKDIKATRKYPFEVQLEHNTKSCNTCDSQGSVHARISIQEPPPVVTPKTGGYHYISGFGFYKRHQQKLNWHKARNVCVSEGADLLVINSEAEAKKLLELSALLLFHTEAEHWNEEAYVGIYDFQHQGHFTTVMGQTLEDSGYVYWSDDEPNNFKDEDCVTLMKNGKYNDVNCSQVFEFICEIPEL